MRRRTLRLEDIRTVVLDEADEMLKMGFLEDIETILAATPESRQTLLFSATMSQEIMVAGFSNEQNTAAVWPSETGTRRHCAVTEGEVALTITPFST